MNVVRRLLHPLSLALGVCLLHGACLAQVATASESPTASPVPMLDELSQVLAQPQRCSDLQAAPTTSALGLEGVLRAVVCNHVGVRSGEGLSTQANASVALAESAAWPTVSAGLGASANRGSSGGQESLLNLQWVLFDFGQRSAEAVRATQGLAAVLDEQRAEVLTAVGQAATLYAAAQAAFGRLDAVTVNRFTAEDSVRVAQTRQAIGASTLGDLLQAQTALAQAKLEEARAMNQWLAARGALAVAMRLPSNAKLILASGEVPDDSAPLSIDALVDEARTHHPRVSAARSRVGQAQARAQAVKAERWGSVALTASSGTSRPSYGSNVEVTRSAQLSWSMPLWDGGALKARQSDAQGAIQTSQVSLDESISQVELQVWQQAQALLSERDVRRNSRAVLESAEAALKVANERFKLGVGQFSDLLLAQNVAANARLQMVESQSNLRREQWRLAAAVGRFGAFIKF